MNEKKSQTIGRRAKVMGLAGIAAFATLGALSLDYGHDGSARIDLAGSGDAPTNTMFVQPSENGMSVGATATFSTPSSVEATVKAAPKSGG